MPRFSVLLLRLLMSFLVVDLACSARGLLDWGILARELAKRPIVERGILASNASANFVARSGRVLLRRAYAEALPEQRYGVSRDAIVWAWAFEQAIRLEPDARVYLDNPSILLYYYATFFWFPRRVEVAPIAYLIKDQVTLREAIVPVTSSAHRDQLRRSGYTHLLQLTPAGPRLVDIRAGREVPEP